MSRQDGVCGGDFSFTSIMARGASGGGIGLTELLSILRMVAVLFVNNYTHTNDVTQHGIVGTCVRC